MELSDKLIKIMSDYNRVQYGIALRQLATLTNIVNERRKLNIKKEIDSSTLTALCAVRKGELRPQKASDYDILTDKKPNPPIA